MRRILTTTLILSSFGLTPAHAQFQRVGSLNNLFDQCTPVKLEMFSRDNEVPPVRKPSAVQAPKSESQASEDPVREKLREFRAKHGGRILKVKGVVGVYVGDDCGVREPHVHILPHKPALVIRVKESSAKAVRQNLLQQVPELSGVVYRIEEVGPDAQPEPGELRCWLFEGC